MRYLNNLRYPILGMLLLLMSASPAFADVPMFPFIASFKLSSFWVLPLIFVIEAAAIRWIFGFAWRRSAIASVVVNLASLLAGYVVYTPVGMMFYLPLASILNRLTGGRAAYFELEATLAGTAVIDTAIELIVLALIFRASISLARASLFLLVNLLTAGVLIAIWLLLAAVS
jgi:hypothetical protein